jgi:hypothetical protein
MGPSDFGICPSGVVAIRAIIGISYRVVEPSVRSVIYQAQSYGRSSKESVPRPIDVKAVVHVDISGVVIIESPAVIVHIHASNTSHPVAAIVYIHITDLGDPTVMIVKNGDVLHLNHGSVIVVLGIGTIIVTGVEGHPVSASRYVILDIKIELPIGIY